MGNIIVSGLKTNKLITQGYGVASAPLGGDSARYYYYTQKKKVLPIRELLLELKALLQQFS